MKLRNDDKHTLRLLLRYLPTHGIFDIYTVHFNEVDNYKQHPNAPKYSEVRLEHLADTLYDYGFVDRHKDDNALFGLTYSLTREGRILKALGSIELYMTVRPLRRAYPVLVVLLPIVLAGLNFLHTRSSESRHKLSLQRLSAEIYVLSQEVEKIRQTHPDTIVQKEISSKKP